MKPEVPYLRATILDKLQKLISSELTTKQQDVVRAVLSGMPVEVIASRTGRNRNAIYKMFHDARKKLRQGFESNDVSSIDLAEACKRFIQRSGLLRGRRLTKGNV